VGEAIRADPDIEPLGRNVPTIEQQVTERLRWLIGTGKLPAGSRLRQRQLADQLGVSQTPVRNGLNQLAQDGFVDLDENGRAYASQLTREDLEELTVARIALEGLAARVGAPNVTDAILKHMKRELRKIEDLAGTGDTASYLEHRWEFHALCYRTARRDRLLTKVERLFWAVGRYNVLLLSSPERFEESVSHYRRFLEAATARDGDAAEQVFEASAHWALDRLRPVLPSEAGS
jgi:DNA-binding GntR family transcriptional regulator